jgi:hypothetical protein
MVTHLDERCFTERLYHKPLDEECQPPDAIVREVCFLKHREREGQPYIPMPRSIFKHEGFKKLSISARLVLIYLFEMEHRYAGNLTYFFRSNKELSDEIGVSERTVQNAKEEFKQHVPDIINMGYVHWWLDKEKTKQSKRKVTSFTIKV